MHYAPRLALLLAIALGLAVGGYAVAQDQGTPDTALCATPVGEADGTPATVTAAATTAATPGGVEPGTPVGLFPCATPIDSQPTSEMGDAGDGDAAAAVQIEFIDIAFVPDELTIPADTDVTLQFVNNGAAVHNFLIEDPEVFSGDLDPGATSELVVNLPAGTYEYICTIPGHAAAGMVGTLTVE
jgi:plastocyanin